MNSCQVHVIQLEASNDLQMKDELVMVMWSRNSTNGKVQPQITDANLYLSLVARSQAQTFKTE